MTDASHNELPMLLEAVRRDRSEGRLADARARLDKALQRYTGADQSNDRIAVLKALAQIERDLGQLSRAQELLEQATALCRQGPDKVRLAHTLRHLGDVLQAQGRADDAMAHLAEAMAVYRGAPDTGQLDLANALRSLALQYELLGQSAPALACWREASELYMHANVAAGVAECLQHLRRP